VKLWMKIIIALFLGLVVGLILGPKAVYLKPIGDGFLKLINMIIVLLILSSMTVGITSIHDPQKLGRVGLKTLFLYMVTTGIAIAIGIIFAKVFKPGVGLELQDTIKEVVVKEPASISEILLNVIPSNPINALSSGHVLQIIFFAFFLGIAINFAGEKGKPVLRFLESLAEVMYSLTSIVMEFTPIGVFAIMAWVAGSFGIKAITWLQQLNTAQHTSTNLFHELPHDLLNTSQPPLLLLNFQHSDENRRDERSHIICLLSSL